MRFSLKLFAFLAFTCLISGCSFMSDGDDGNKIVIWHWMNDRDDAFKSLAETYEKEKGIKVEFKLFSPPDIYSQKVIAAARAGNLPDIFGILGEKKILASFIKAGYVLDLTPYLTEKSPSWNERFFPQAIGVVSFKKDNVYTVKEGVYGIPIDITVLEFLYNKDLFKQAGLDPDSPPDTFRDFIDYAKQIQDRTEASGFICGWGESWLLYALAVEWAFNIMGEEKFIKTIEGEVPYTDNDWIRVFSLFKEIREAGILASNITTMINKESEDKFSKGEAGFSFNGSWAVNVYNQLNPDLNYVFFSLPRVSDKNPLRIWGGAGSAFMVNSNSSKKKKVIDFLNWLTSEKQQVFLVKETNNLPAVKGCGDALSDMLAPLAEDFDMLTHPNIWPYNENSRVIEVLDKGLQQIVMGIKSPEEVASEAQNVKERVMKR